MTADTGTELAADLTAAGKPHLSPWPLAEETLTAMPGLSYLWDASLPVRPATDEEKARPVPADLAAILAAPVPEPAAEPEPEAAPEPEPVPDTADEAQRAAQDSLNRWAPGRELPGQTGTPLTAVIPVTDEPTGIIPVTEVTPEVTES